MTTEPNIFYNHLNEYNEAFILNMEDFNELYINNGLAYDTTGKGDDRYNKLLANIEHINSNLFKLNNSLDINISNLDNILKSKLSILDKSKKINLKLNKNINNLNNSNETAIEMNKEITLLYSNSNIYIFNKIVGIILLIYILRNL